MNRKMLECIAKFYSRNWKKNYLILTEIFKYEF
jgi:hypothetical protein